MAQQDRPRLRDIGVTLGALPPGPLNAITDVDGVRVGHTTLIQGEGPLRPGHGPIRTGATAILPHAVNLLRDNPDIGVTTGGVNPLVGECNDGYVNDNGNTRLALPIDRLQEVLRRYGRL